MLRTRARTGVRAEARGERAPDVLSEMAAKFDRFASVLADVAEGTLAAGTKLRTVQTGRIQNYVYGLLGGVAFFTIIQYFLR